MINYPLNVTIDTNVFDENKYDFAEESTLSRLISYVQKQKIKVIVSNIVINEISKHVQDKAREIGTKVNALRKEVKGKYSESIIKNVGMEHILIKANREDMARQAKADLDVFLEKLNIEILDSKNVDVEKIFADYFMFCPPFENNDKKRKEFPDAFIVAEIKERFKNGEQLAIISKDNGFRQALADEPNYLFFSSLGELYDTLNKQEQRYDKSIEYLSKYRRDICQKVKYYIVNNDCINVVGVSYDKDGVAEGYDYSETILHKVADVSFKIHTIDEISEEQVYATLVCNADIDVDCYYEDYDNAAWDSEREEYFYLETRQVKEIHTARFAVKIKFDLQSEEFEISNFVIILGGDSRKKRIEIENDGFYDYEQDVIDMDRESVGLLAMNEYEDFLEENLADSKMKHDFVEKFEEINSLLLNFEDICMIYDEVIGLVKTESNKAKEFISELARESNEIEDFPLDMEGLEIGEEDIFEFLAWLQDKYSEVIIFSDAEKLPDDIEFGKSIKFLDANNSVYTFAIGEIQINPSEGEEEYIDMWLSNDSGQESKNGFIKLTVGYMNYDEDGGIADGLSDDVDYYYDEIIKEMDFVIEGLRKRFNEHDMISQLLQRLY